MSQRQKSRKERIIPIKIEGEASSSNTNSRDKNTKEINNEAESDIEIINDESNASSDDVVVCSHSKTQDKTVEIVPWKTIASYNVPEKIIIVFDRAIDENSTHFQITSGKQYSPFFMLQHALQIFLLNKHTIDAKHEFALIFLNENTATWVHDFTNSPQDIIASLQSTTSCEPEDIFSLNTAFDLISEKVTLHPTMDDLLIPPTFVVRTVLLYGRSYSIPLLKRTPEIDYLLSSPYFIVDIVMTHEPATSANHSERILKILQEVDAKGVAYTFSVSRNASELHKAMAKILSHPLQRVPQCIAKYNIETSD